MSNVFSRRREQSTAIEQSTIKTGTLVRKNAVTGTIVQTIPISFPAYGFNQGKVTWDALHLGPPYTSGGPFASVEARVDANVLKGVGKYKSKVPDGGLIWEYQGGFVRPAFGWEAALIPKYQGIAVANPYQSGGPLTSILSMGPEAFDRMRPKIESVDLAISLAELDELPRMLKTSAAAFRSAWLGMGGNLKGSQMRKQTADNFLNVQFGWVPFLSDIRKAYATYQKQRDIVKRLTAQNGKWVKKHRVLRTERTHSVIHSGYATAGYMAPWRSEFMGMCDPLRPGTSDFNYHEQHLSSEKEIWSVGSFKFYRPEFDDSLQEYDSLWHNTMRILGIYGIRVNPSVLWEVTPWTWLIDWFTGFGSLINRITAWAQDLVVSRYAYLCQREVSTLRHIATMGFSPKPVTCVWENYFTTKQREEAASPYSFTLTGPLSARQLAILAALGISRTH